MKEKNITKVFALGGLEEVGKNTYCLEHDNEIIIIDAGIKFPEKVLFGVKKIIPDYQYLIDNQKKIKGLFVTHGHEDHIGGIPYLLNKITLPKIYSPVLASDLIKLKLKGEDKNLVVEFNEKSTVTLQHFEITFFRVAHSIPNSFGIRVKTPNGVVVSTGDFKLDLTPLGTKASIHKISEIGQGGVTLLLSDSTNSEIEGYTITENKIINNIARTITQTKKRVLITTFASNVDRIFWIIKVAQQAGKKVVMVGKAMKEMINIISKKKYFEIDPKMLVEEEAMKSLTPEKMVVICTGSQGESNSTISKIANSEHQTIKGGETDLVIFSSRPIPGNNYEIENIINKLKKRKVEVLISCDENVFHTSGHACQEEQKMMITLLKPKYFMPMHGEYRMLKIHGQTATEVGVAKKNVFVCRNGDQVYLYENKAWMGNRIIVNSAFIGDKDTEQTMELLNERQLMLKNGIFEVILTFNAVNKQLNRRVQIISRGSFYVDKETNFNEEIVEQLTNEVKRLLQIESFNAEKIRKKITSLTSQLVYEKKKISPLINVQMLFKEK